MEPCSEIDRSSHRIKHGEKAATSSSSTSSHHTTTFHAAIPVSTTNFQRALVIEDVREATMLLRSMGYEVDRITHAELMSHLGERYAGNLKHLRYHILWISTPADWYVRTPGKRSGPHWQRLMSWLTTATNMKIPVVMFGPLGESGDCQQYMIRLKTSSSNGLDFVCAVLMNALTNRRKRPAVRT